MLPMVPAAEGHQVDQLEPTSPPTDNTRREGDVCCGRIKTDEKWTEKELIQESETERKVEVGVGHSSV